MISIEAHIQEIERMNNVSKKMTKFLEELETNQKHLKLPQIYQEHSPSKMNKITSEVKKGSILVEIIILDRYDSNPFLLAYTLKPRSITKTIPPMKLSPEDKNPIIQTYPFDLSSSSEYNVIYLDKLSVTQYKLWEAPGTSQISQLVSLSYN